MKLPELMRATAELMDITNEEDPEGIKTFYHALIFLRDTLNKIIEEYPG